MGRGGRGVAGRMGKAGSASEGRAGGRRRRAGSRARALGRRRPAPRSRPRPPPSGAPQGCRLLLMCGTFCESGVPSRGLDLIHPEGGAPWLGSGQGGRLGTS